MKAPKELTAKMSALNTDIIKCSGMRADIRCLIHFAVGRSRLQTTITLVTFTLVLANLTEPPTGSRAALINPQYLHYKTQKTESLHGKILSSKSHIW